MLGGRRALSAGVRDAYARLLAQGWTDALRSLNPDQVVYTFWDYFRNAYGRNAGLRIDHLLLSPARQGVSSVRALTETVRGRDKPSDHAPVWVTVSTPADRTDFSGTKAVQESRIDSVWPAREPRLARSEGQAPAAGRRARRVESGASSY